MTIVLVIRKMETASRIIITAGNYITIDHGNGFSTVYMHCSALKVSVGDTVTQGQTIGLMGTTGNSNGVHLHFAMIKNGTYVNPQSYL